jgi:phage FluMu protein Com
MEGSGIMKCKLCGKRLYFNIPYIGHLEIRCPEHGIRKEGNTHTNKLAQDLTLQEVEQIFDVKLKDCEFEL